jgi:hypothetical protein
MSPSRLLRQLLVAGSYRGSRPGGTYTEWMPDDPVFEPTPEPSKYEYRRAFTLSRTVDRETGVIESREAARRKYREQGLVTPDEGDAYYEG